MRIAINGLGRIGRLLLRRLIHHPGIDVVAVNDLMSPENLAYLFRYDSIYGTFPGEVSYVKGQLLIDGKRVVVWQQPDPLQLPWEALEIDVVIECTGSFSTRPTASLHLQAGAKKVMLSTTGSPDIPLFIYGYNQHELKTGADILSPGGCMTNCSIPILDILDGFGIMSAQVHFLHSYTSRQQLVDAPHRQYRRGRAAAESIIPVEIDLAESLERLMPHLNGKVASISTRIPVANGALGDFTVHLQQAVTVPQIRETFRQASQERYKDVVAYTEEPLVSLDVKGNTHSSVIEGPLISMVGGQVKIFAWFDNEFGYTSRIIDWLGYWKKFL
ncbi:MAG TPA: glyceraldehyde 3-phosphate dehydrogenase NAD-binding domain-containing protein [Phnomibacter sp.]|nr:glyceraldehyde 3-phosphate dehydrogenase NAD-binding domain-containing protein [Phnomibacter sp.]